MMAKRNDEPDSRDWIPPEDMVGISSRSTALGPAWTSTAMAQRKR
jgi:hypothetical protein